jgi:phage shock protein PspC (stress-responsive transcriptional regulator)
MKTTVTINLSGRSFYIDDDAYNRLKSYIDKIETWFKNKEGGPEIISDIENRISEIFSQRINPDTEVVTLQMVEEAIKTMGEPEQIAGEPTDDGDNNPTTPPRFTSPKRLYRDIDNRVFGGVCAGIANYFNIDPVLARILFVVLSVASVGTGILIYLVLWVAIPPALTTAQKLEMKGENITISNIEKTVREEFEEVKKNFRNFGNSEPVRKGRSYLSRFNKTDQTILIAAVVIMGFMLLIGIITKFHFPGFIVHETVNGFGMPFHFSFPGVFPIAAILLIIGLIFRDFFKIAIYLIVIILIIAFFLKAAGWFYHSPVVLTLKDAVLNATNLI